MNFQRVLSAVLAALTFVAAFAAFPAPPVLAASSFRSDFYYIDKAGGFLYDVEPGTSVSQLKARVTNPDGAVSVTDRKGAPRGDSVRAVTGDALVCGEESLQVIVKGDLNGDGMLSAADLAVLACHINASHTLSGVHLYAGDMDYDGNAGSNDYIALKKHLKGQLNIYSDKHPSEQVNCTVTFAAGEGGSLSGKAVFTVEEGTPWDAIAVPEPVPASGYEFDRWTPEFPEEVTEDVTYTAAFSPLSTCKVVFLAGENGSLNGSWCFENISAGTLWSEAVTVPEPVPASGYVFDCWSPPLPAADTAITSNLTYKAMFREDTPAVTRTNYASAANGGTYAHLVGTELDSYKDAYTVVSTQEYTSGGQTATIDFGNGLLNNGASVSVYDGDWVERAYASYSGNSDPAQIHVVMFVVKLKSSKKDIERVTVNCGNSSASSNRGLPDKVTVKYSTKSSYSSNMKWADFGETTVFESIGGYGYRAAVDAAAPKSARYLQITLSMNNFYVARIGEIQVLGPEKQTTSHSVNFVAGEGGALSGPASFTVADGTSWSEIAVPPPLANEGYEFKYWSPTLPAQTATVTADASYTAVFAVPGVVVKNYALSANGGEYKVSAGTVPPAHPDSFDPCAGYGSGRLNDGVLLAETGDPWVEIERAGTVISITVKLSVPVNMTRAVINLGLVHGTTGLALPQSVSVYAGKTESSVSPVGSSYAVVPHGGYGYTLTVEGSVQDVRYVRFDGEMKGTIAQFGEVEVYGSLSSAVPTYSVTFTAGDHGSLTGETAVTVEEGTPWTDIAVPSPVADDGYVFDCWTPALPADGDTVGSDLHFTANFAYDPSRWRTVTFEAGANGALAGTDSYTVLSGTPWGDIDVPDPVPNSGFVFAGWTPVLPSSASHVTESAVYTANFEEAPAVQYTVTFAAGEGGALSGAASHTVDEGAPWSSVPVPEPLADDGYEFVAWSPALPEPTSQIHSDLAFTATFAPSGGQSLKGVININGINASQNITGGSHIYTDNYANYFTAVYWQVFAAGYSAEKGGYIVTAIYDVGATKSVEVPTGGILVAVHLGADNQPACASVRIGDLLVPNPNIDIVDGTFVAGDSYISVYAGDGTLPDETGGTTPPPPPPPPGEYTPLNYPKVKAMWLSQFDLNKVYTSGSSQRPENSFRSLMTTILDNCVSVGVNTIIVQVRPNGDSMYPSQYYTMSKYVVGAYGREAIYDPFAVIVELAHERNLSVQAWINPLRLMTASEIASVEAKYKVGEWYQSSEYNGKYVVQSGNNFYLNPAYDETRQLIIDGAREICTLYNVDGVHMDDYFYPTTAASFDSEAYAAYTGSLSLVDWRRDNISKVVKGIYDAVKSVGGNRQFGISPAGNMDTVYGSQYADVYKWCSSPGYIDYICPQVYFGMLHKTQGFANCSTRWSNIVTNPNVRLYVGMTLGKALNGYNGTPDQYGGTTEGQYEWINHRDVLKTCLEYVRDSLTECTGVVYFCYQYFYDPVTGASVVGTEEERSNFLPVLQSMWQN